MLRARAPGYGLALLAGLLAAWMLVPRPTLQGTGGLFRFPSGDLPQNLIGHLAFQENGWHWPVLRAPSLALAGGESIALTDSNPVLSIGAKLLAGAVGHRTNLFGVWLALCLVLQPLSAIYALRGIAPRLGVNTVPACLVAAVFSILLPEFLFRAIHINLWGQFLIWIALGMAARACRSGRAAPTGAMAAFLCLAVLIHPMLFILSAAILFAPVLSLAIARDPGARPALRNYFACVLGAAGIFVFANGAPAGGGPGFGLYSTNLLSPVWPQLSGLFGPARPILDATGYQHEGFNYLGAGLLLVLAAAMACLATLGNAERLLMTRRWAGLLAVAVALMALALTPNLTFGPFALTRAPLPVLDHVFGIVRASGRAVWVVDDIAIAGAIGLLAARLRPVLFWPLAALAVLLQWADCRPLLGAAGAYLAGEGQAAPGLSLPPGTSLFRVVPFCGNSEVLADQYRLLAIRAGAHLAEMRLAHPATETVCAQALAAGMSSSWQRGETRLFLPEIGHQPRPMEDAVTCSGQPAGLVCHRPAG